MISQKIVSPSKIESELQKIWGTLSKKNTNKANLFTLIVFAKKTDRLGYVRDTIQNIIEKFPCRVIFITYEKNSKEDYLKTAVSVLFLPKEEKEIACDSIDIGIGKGDIEKVKYVVLPLILPDLPIHLFWCENPKLETKLLFDLKELASKVIFDSSTTENLFDFARFITRDFMDIKKDIVDLNWLKTDELREIITSEFYNAEKLEVLNNTSSITLQVNKKDEEVNQHFLIQTYYILFWLAASLNWRYKEHKIETNSQYFTFEGSKSNILATINVESNNKFLSEDILKISFVANENSKITFKRSDKILNSFEVESITSKQCDLPHNFRFKKVKIGNFLADEMVSQKKSNHFTKTLIEIAKIDD